MFSFLKRKSKTPASDASIAEDNTVDNSQELSPADEPAEEKTDNAPQPGFFSRLKQGLSRTSSKLTEGFASLILGRKNIDDDLLEELETQLLTADLGVEATTRIITAWPANN